MNLVPVKSSTVSHIGYDPLTKKMHVRFKNGGQYVYHDVSAAEHEALVGADSIGAHFSDRIRDRYKHTKL